MSAAVLTVEAAKEAKFDLIENGRGTQAVHDVVVALRANRRSGTASTKSKAEVNLSGAKPWRQKGTGRARAGYKSSPVWVGGGVAFGPRPRDYSKKVTKSVRRLALKKALSARILAGDVLVVDDFIISQPKTKEFVGWVKENVGVEKTLIISNVFDENTFKAARNVQPTRLITSSEVNTENLLAFKKIVLTRAALATLVERTQP
ncbi:MAG TPA: 50S ribosomal protein L4 [Chthoniobacteraceae bacterium]|nr:50S ribosomal protein L4 [Chthoniobacteraceae bacterium]